jgi:hypothetical protein
MSKNFTAVGLGAVQVQHLCMVMPKVAAMLHFVIVR